jgi:hypothetical protein
MQTTLDVDADVLSAAEKISARTHCNTGKVISDLARAGLAATRKESPEPTVLNGFQVTAIPQRRLKVD